MTWSIRFFDPDDLIPDHRLDVLIWYEGTALHRAVHVPNHDAPVDDEGGVWFRTTGGTMAYLPSIELDYHDDGGNMLIIDGCDDDE